MKINNNLLQLFMTFMVATFVHGEDNYVINKDYGAKVSTFRFLLNRSKEKLIPHLRYRHYP